MRSSLYFGFFTILQMITCLYPEGQCDPCCPISTYCMNVVLPPSIPGILVSTFKGLLPSMQIKQIPSFVHNCICTLLFSIIKTLLVYNLVKANSLGRIHIDITTAYQTPFLNLLDDKNSMVKMSLLNSRHYQCQHTFIQYMKLSHEQFDVLQQL